MKRLTLAAICLLLAGCAQFDQMTPQERKIVWGAIGASLVAGYIAKDDDPDITNVYQGDTIIHCNGAHPRFCE